MRRPFSRALTDKGFLKGIANTTDLGSVGQALLISCATTRTDGLIVARPKQFLGFVQSVEETLGQTADDALVRDATSNTVQSRCVTAFQNI